MPQRDGDGWIDCKCGQQHWGLHGAAGIAILDFESQFILLQQRAEWTHGGQTWALPGGAIDSHENPVEAALRELEEELGVGAHHIEVLGSELFFDHDSWRYHTVIARKLTDFQVSHNDETLTVEWVPLPTVTTYDLHPSFAISWNELRVSLDILIKRELDEMF